MKGKVLPRCPKVEFGVHMHRTEARNLDEALQIIKEKQRRANQAEATRKAHHEPNTLHSISTMAANQAKFKEWKKKHPSTSKTPHPFRDMPEDQKREKMRELYYSKAWGFGVKAHRDLSKKFGVSYDQAVEWIGDKVHSEYAEDANYQQLCYEARERYRRLERFRERSRDF